MEKKIILTEKQAEDIVDVLDGILKEVDCFADEVGEENCIHCQALLAVKHLSSAGLKLDVESDDDSDDELLMEPGC